MRKYVGPIVSAVILSICVLIAELALTVLAPVPDPFEQVKLNRPPNRYIRSEFPRNVSVVTEAEEGLPGVQGRHHFTTNNMGFRGDQMSVPKAPNELRIFMVGGSTTECFYLDDSESVSRVLQVELDGRLSDGRVAKVYNAGKSGDASADHISMIVHRIVHLEPDVIVVFSGFNDLHRAIYNYDYLHYVNVTQKKLPLLRMMVTEFQIPRRLYSIVRERSEDPVETLERIPLKSDYHRKIALRKSVPASNVKPRTDLSSYRRNLSTIIGVARAHGIRLVLITQQTTWNSRVDPEAVEWHWLRYRNGVTYREDFMEEALDSMNTVMRVLAEQHGVPVYDLARIIPKSSEYFYDDAHFNVKGAARAGKELAEVVFDNVLAASARSKISLELNRRDGGP
jgi:lysophospholipase L1-like esterase